MWSSIQIKFCRSFRINNHRLSSLSPSVYQTRFEDLDLCQLLVILLICSFKNKYIFRNTSNSYSYYWRLYLCVKSSWFILIFFHHVIFHLAYYCEHWLWSKIIIWSILPIDLTFLPIFFISIIRYFCYFLIEETILSHSPSPSKVAYIYFSSNIYFHPKEKYVGVVYKKTRPLDFQNDFIKFSL